MWIDTKVNCERRLVNMAKQKQLFIEQVSKNSTAYQLKLGAGTFGTVIGFYDDLQAAVGEYEDICAALNRGDNYYKAFKDEEAGNIDEG